MELTVIHEAIISGNSIEVAENTQKALDQGNDPTVILNRGLIAAMDLVGEKFASGDLYIPEMLQAAMAMKNGLKLLEPFLTAEKAKQKGTVVIGSVKGDMHDIGKDLVVMMLESAGFKVIDLGVNISPQSFLNSVKQNKAHICAMSSLLTTTMPGMKKTVDLLKKELAHDPVKTIIIKFYYTLGG